MICGANNIDKNVRADIVKGINSTYAIQLVKCKFYNCKVIVTGTYQIKYAIRKMNNNDVTYIDLDHAWTASGGILNTNLYYKDNLHLVKKGNKKLVKAITTAFNVGALKQQQNLPQIGQ